LKKKKEKNIFPLTLQGMQGQLQLFLVLANFELDEMTSYKHVLAANCSFKMAASKVEFWASFETNFFGIAGTLEAETLVSAKPNVYLL